MEGSPTVTRLVTWNSNLHFSSNEAQLVQIMKGTFQGLEPPPVYYFTDLEASHISPF